MVVAAGVALLWGIGSIAAQAEPHVLVQAVHEHELDAIARLRLHPADSAQLLLDDLDLRIELEQSDHAQRDLRALAALGYVDNDVVQRLTDVVDAASHSVRVEILRTLGDLVINLSDTRELSKWLVDHGSAQRMPAQAILPGTMVVPPEPPRGDSVIERGIDPEQAAGATIVELVRKADSKLLHRQPEFARLATRVRLSPESSTDRLVQWLYSDDPNTSEFAAERLGDRGVGIALAIVVPRLEQLMKARRLTTRLVAARATIALVPRNAAALAAHRVIFEGGRDDERLESVIALREHSGDPVAIAETLRPMVEEPCDPLLCREALTTLATLGTAARGLLPAIERVRERDDPMLSAAVQAAIRAIDK